MDKELEQLLEQLKEVANDTQSQSQFQEATPTQEYTPQQDNSNVEERFRSWKEIGIIRFTSKYQHLPKFSQILNMIVPKADRKVLADIQANKVREEYLDYLEDAYKEAIKEIASFSKDILSSQVQTNRQPTTNQRQIPDYDMDKYYNDYKKFLEDITVKDVAVIEFRDGLVDDNGKMRAVGIPKATLDEKIKLHTEN
ncbi:MAG: hypothetical protein JHC31_16005 [Sulfurihydrogenibium sp.]|nr:hypothetical protein [Sulfurihydrogenibium sp.]